MVVFEKAQSATPQQEVCVPGSELRHAGGNGRYSAEETCKRTAPEREQSLFAFIWCGYIFVRYDASALHAKRNWMIYLFQNTSLSGYQKCSNVNHDILLFQWKGQNVQDFYFSGLPFVSFFFLACNVIKSLKTLNLANYLFVWWPALDFIGHWQRGAFKGVLPVCWKKKVSLTSCPT